jgi:hypothetical protein
MIFATIFSKERSLILHRENGKLLYYRIRLSSFLVTQATLRMYPKTSGMSVLVVQLPMNARNS